jgi:hypothetical protein
VLTAVDDELPDLSDCDSLHLELGDGRWLVLTHDIKASAKEARRVLTDEEFRAFVAALQDKLRDSDS